MALLGGWAGLAGCLERPRQAETPPFLDGVTNVAHQGGNLIGPGNTIPTFEAALEAGADVLEMDLWLTADDEIVVIHDATVDRTTDGSGWVEELTLDAIRELDAAYHWPTDVPGEHPHRGEGYRIPTLEEVIDRFPEVPLLLEPKHESVPPDRLVAELESADLLDRVIVGAFEDDVLREVRELAPEVPTGLGPKEGRRFLLALRANEASYEPPGELLFPPHEVVSGEIVERAHRVGLEVYPWTVNERAAMERLVELGVDGIITDEPVMLQDVLATREFYGGSIGDGPAREEPT